MIERARPSRCRVRQPRLAHARSQAMPAVLDVPRKEGRTMGRASVVVLMTLVAGGCGEGTPDSSRQLGDTTFVFSSSPLRGTASLREISSNRHDRRSTGVPVGHVPDVHGRPGRKSLRRGWSAPALRCRWHIRQDDRTSRPGTRRGEGRGGHGRLSSMNAGTCWADSSEWPGHPRHAERPVVRPSDSGIRRSDGHTWVWPASLGGL